ncbi:endolytic transglycosylase MltG [Microbulbifer agarilyticus]|uniref:endolytic transglycosylase MltG n=1 Tax=Microbulbifer agarilyticus TaxID=260552 RepID=UPI001CD1F41E|nr:endolytic transglycosylase MltG [Microbulbifer agarilyticus]MCA0901038.1 endolytic transglycosylase MltG [Microbulbifer agarilyticus]
MVAKKENRKKASSNSSKGKTAKVSSLGKFVRGALVLLVLGVITGGASLWFINSALIAPLSVPAQGLRMDVEAGSNLSRVVHGLAVDGVVKHPRLVLGYARIKKLGHIHPGEYMIPAGSNAMDLVARLNRGDVTRYRVTLVEGWTFQQALNQIRASQKIRSTDAGASVQSAAQALGIDGNPEGQIFPDTYIYRSGTSDLDLLRQASQRMNKVLAEEWEKRGNDLPYGSPYDALIMASIVEKETGVPWERDEIAGVFVRRLGKGMRLQTDPTVIYGMGAKYDGNLRRADLRQPTPYNTYVISGMPPTPIALPGREAIHAALHPKPGKSLYFVAKGDGSHYFSETLSEHNKAVRQYQLRRRSDYRSSPGKVQEN